MTAWPRYWDQYAWLADVAQLLLTERRNRYPGLVSKGKLTNVQAGDGLRLMQAVADEWRAIADLQPEPEGAHLVWRGDKAATLVSARNLYAHRLGKAANDPRLGATLEAIDILLWHYQRERYGPIFPRDEADRKIAEAAARCAPEQREAA